MIGKVTVTSTTGLGQRLKAIRLYLGHLRSDIARAAKLDPEELEGIEDHGQIPDSAALKRLCDLYQVPTSAIYGDSHPALDMDISGLQSEDRKELEDFAQYLRWRKEHRESNRG